MAEAYQSLYRRYRPQRFSEVRGQDHVTMALRNAVRDARVAQGYLFSGPRGTGKTSSARILAKALNCLAQDGGEPCGTCDSCVQVTAGTSFDVIELDAASNNGVDAMRELAARANLGTPGRWKVYIVDEVHMLSTAASNALLKTLEEPPPHVVFVLATTNPEKVLPTIRSRVQHYEFHLLGADVLGSLLADVNTAAGLGLPGDALQTVVRRGAGSARDALSALDQAAALGGVTEEVAVADEVAEALCDRDSGRALAAVASGCAAGRDPRQLTQDVLERMRDIFLTRVAPDVVSLPPDDQARVADQAARLSPAALTRSMEALGDALALMKDALDPRVCLEVALVRITRPDADVSPAALLERIERLERGVAADPPAPSAPPPAPPVPAPTPATAAVSGPPTAAPAPQPAAPAPAPTVPAGAVTPPPSTPPRTRPSDASRAVLGARPPAAPARKAAAPPAPPRPAPPSAAPAPARTPAGGGSLPTRDALVKAWGDTILESLPPGVKSRWRAGRFVAADDGGAQFALPNPVHRDMCEQRRAEVEAALAAHFGVRVPLRLVVEDAPAVPTASGTAEEPDEPFDMSELTEAPPQETSPEAVVQKHFPGAEEIPG